MMIIWRSLKIFCILRWDRRLRVDDCFWKNMRTSHVKLESELTSHLSSIRKLNELNFYIDYKRRASSRTKKNDVTESFTRRSKTDWLRMKEMTYRLRRKTSQTNDRLSDLLRGVPFRRLDIERAGTTDLTYIRFKRARLTYLSHRKVLIPYRLTTISHSDESCIY